MSILLGSPYGERRLPSWKEFTCQPGRYSMGGELDARAWRGRPSSVRAHATFDGTQVWAVGANASTWSRHAVVTSRSSGHAELSKKSEQPQVAQNPRRASGEDWYQVGSAPSSARVAREKVAHATGVAPTLSLHIAQ